MVEKCLLVVCAFFAGAYAEHRHSIKSGAALLRAFGSAFTTKKEETKTESETEKETN